MLLFLWRSRSTLLTCHIAVVFCFCSSLQQELTSAFLFSGSCFVNRSCYCGFPGFVSPLIVVVYCLSLPILLDSVLIFHMCFYMEGSFCSKEQSIWVPFFPNHSCLFDTWWVGMCPLIFKFPVCSGTQLSLVSEFFASLLNAHASVTVGMDGISLVSFCSRSMFFQLCFRLNWIILLWFLRDTILIL